jgi:RNA polymerase sigma factor (TIGR02999 family)
MLATRQDVAVPEASDRVQSRRDGAAPRWTAGDIAARDQLMTVVYQELRCRAAWQLRRERRGRTLQPTALVHQAYVRLVNQRRMVWQNRGQFFGVACQMMWRSLVDRPRALRMAKRSGSGRGSRWTIWSGQRPGGR